MKTSFHVSQGGLRSINGMIVPLPLGVNRVEPPTDKNRQRSYKDGSKTLYVHQFNYYYNHEGAVLAWIEHKADCKRLIEAITDVKTTDHIHLFWSESLYGQALTDYHGAVNTAKGNGTLKQEHIDAGLNALDKRVFPHNAAALQTKYLLRFARKPLEMTSQQAFDTMCLYNDYLRDFPNLEITKPDGTIESTKPTPLPRNILIICLEGGLPKSWDKYLIEQGVNSVITPEHEFLATLERKEAIEAVENTSNKSQKAKSGDADSKKQGAVSSRSTSGAASAGKKKNQQTHQKKCALHGPGHSTDECKVLLAQAEKMKSAWEARSNDYTRPSKSKKVKFSPSNNEMNEMMQQAADTAVSAFVKKLKASKKRKAEMHHMESDDDASLASAVDDLSIDSSDGEDPPERN